MTTDPDVSTLQAQIKTLTAERDHWKANHTDQVQRARILIERTDMPMERVRAYQTMQTLRQDAERFREILSAVVRELGDDEDDGNAPGHGHSVPGVWDSDNGAKAGTICAWCKAWSLAKAAIE